MMLVAILHGNVGSEVGMFVYMNLRYAWKTKKKFFFHILEQKISHQWTCAAVSACFCCVCFFFCFFLYTPPSCKLFIGVYCFHLVCLSVFLLHIRFWMGVSNKHYLFTFLVVVVLVFFLFFFCISAIWWKYNSTLKCHILISDKFLILLLLCMTEYYRNSQVDQIDVTVYNLIWSTLSVCLNIGTDKALFFFSAKKYW